MADLCAEPRRAPVSSAEVVAAGGLLALATACFLSPQHIADGPVICPFRRLTGLPCPGCGLTRSFVYLVHGWWRDALLANPFGPVLVALVLALSVAVVAARVRRRPSPDLDRVVRMSWLRPVLIAWLTFAVVRIGVDLAT